MPACVVPGCARPAENNLGIRLRRPDTSAIWAPNLDAFVCDEHAVAGVRIEILFEPTGSGEVETVVHGASPDDPRRASEIRQPARRLDDDLALHARRQVPAT